MRENNGQAGETSEGFPQETCDLPGSRISRLAQSLFERMNHLSPLPCETQWGDLSTREREFYVLLVEGVLTDASAINRFRSS